MKLLLAIIFGFLVVLGPITSAAKKHFLFENESYHKVYSREFVKYTKTGEKSNLLQKYEAHLRDDYQRTNAANLKTGLERTNVFCVMCRSLIEVVLELRHDHNATEQSLVEQVTSICVDLGLQSHNVCHGLVSLNMPTVLRIVDSRREITADIVCGVVLQDRYCVFDSDMMEFTIDVDQSVTGEIEPKDNTPSRDPDDLVILQLTDIHYDPNYREGANADCGEPACCRVLQGFPDDQSVAAGRWGDYRDCDSPWVAVEDVFAQFQNDNHNIDIVYFTGDIVDHGIWETSYTTNLESIRDVFGILRTTFNGTPVYPIVGNHEPHPVNQFAPPSVTEVEFSSEWLYEFLADEWRDWLPSEALETVRLGGYYTVLIRPGFRLIALNNNECYTFNWWMMYEPEYPSVQLQWLHDVLLEAEENDEYVHIIGHVPSGSGDCFQVWAEQYRRIVDRFYRIISAQFNGHSHKDEFNIYYSRETNIPINVAWNGGSTTAFSLVNPNYRIYFADNESFQVTDHETWIYNLTLANINREQNPEWYRSYSFQNEYDLADLSPASLDGLVETMARDPSLLRRYWELKGKLGDAFLAAGCNDACLQSHLCDIVTTEFGDVDRCNELNALAKEVANYNSIN